MSKAKRVPMKMNPVTGKMEEIKKGDPMLGGAGMKRDGCMSIPDKYLTAALDAGLGAAGGMYGHIGTLNRVRKGGSAATASAPESRKYVGASDLGGNPIRGDQKRGGAAPLSTGGGGIKQMVQGALRSVKSSGSAGSARMGDDVHFNKRKGVINTIGGAKDVTRASKSSGGDGEGIRRSDRLKSSGIHTLGGGSAGSSRAPRGGSAGSSRQTGLHTFGTLEHDSKVGLRKGDGVGGGAGASVSSAPRTGVASLGDGVTVHAPGKKKPSRAQSKKAAGGGSPTVGSVIKTGKSSSSSSSSSRRTETIVRTLGGGGGGGSTAGGSKTGGGKGTSGMSDREKRLAFFDKKAA